MDTRPICTCNAYKFPHRTGGKCKGVDFVTYYHMFDTHACVTCNCKQEYTCDVEFGQESIKEAECYIEAQHYNPGGYLPLTFEEPTREEYND